MGSSGQTFWKSVLKSRHERSRSTKRQTSCITFREQWNPRAKEPLRQISHAPIPRRCEKWLSITFSGSPASQVSEGADNGKKDWEKWSAFYDFPGERRPYIRTTIPIEILFATVRHRREKNKRGVKKRTILVTISKPARTAPEVMVSYPYI